MIKNAKCPPQLHAIKANKTTWGHYSEQSKLKEQNDLMS